MNAYIEGSLGSGTKLLKFLPRLVSISIPVDGICKCRMIRIPTITLIPSANANTNDPDSRNVSFVSCLVSYGFGFVPVRQDSGSVRFVLVLYMYW